MGAQQLSLFTSKPAARPRVKENAIQGGIVMGYRSYGYLTLETNEHRRPVRCPCCSHFFTPAGGNGRQAGVPDLLVSHEEWPQGLWFGVEIKGSHTAVSPAQQELRAAQRIVVARSFEEAWNATTRFEAWRQGQAQDRTGDVARLSAALLEIRNGLIDLIHSGAHRLQLNLLKLKAERALRTMDSQTRS